MKSTWKILLLCHIFIGAVSGHCPNGCDCANTVVECKCTSTDGVMTLGSFRNIDFLSKIYIHSCRNLTIPTDAFAGLAIGQELSIGSVQYLHILPFAFRGLIKYPERFTIYQCDIPILSANAFLGFHRVAHMWFRNVNVGKISEGAFRHVTDIEYFYFRESNLGRIEPHAFSNMSNISHFFIRGKIRIDRIDPSAFQNSRFKKIIFEEARIRSMNAYAFNGPIRYESMLFDNVTVEHIDTGHGNSKIVKISSARKLDFVRCRFMGRLPLGALCSNVLEVKFEDTSIDRLVALPASSLQNITRLRFTRSSIQAIDSKAMYGSSNIRTITFEDSIIKAVGEKAFGSIADLEELNFLKCSISLFGGYAFENAAINRMSLTGCSIEVVKTRAFGDCQIGRLRFAYSDLKTVEPESFGRLGGDYLGFEHTRVKEIKEHAFAKARVNILNISNCDLRPHVNETWLAGASFHRLLLNTNTFACSCSSKMPMELAELKAQKELMTSNFLSVSNNFCVEEATNDTLMLEDYFLAVCKKPTSELTDNSEMIPGLKCSKTLFMVSCTCLGTDSDQSIVIDEGLTKKLSLLLNASTFTISHCRRLRWARNAISYLSLSHLIISHCGKVELETDFWWQKSAPSVTLVRVSHVGRLRLHRNAFSFLQPSPVSSLINPTALEFINCTIKKIGADAFENARIGTLAFIGSRIASIGPLFARKSHIDDFYIENSEVGRMSSWAFNDSVVEKFRVERSRIHELQANFVSDKLTKRAFVCFVDNQLACHCDVRGLEAIAEVNGCDGASNTCFDSQGDPEKPASDAFLASYEAGTRRCYESVNGDLEGAYDLPQRDTAGLVHSASKSVADWKSWSMCLLMWLLFTL